jgi:hypothetical protein
LHVQQIKQKALEEQLKALTAHYHALIQQLTSASDAQEAAKVKQDLRDLADEIAALAVQDLAERLSIAAEQIKVLEARGHLARCQPRLPAAGPSLCPSCPGGLADLLGGRRRDVLLSQREQSKTVPL